MRKEPLRVGFLGASNIAHKVWLAVDRCGHRVTYIGCRDAAKGAALIDDVQKKLEAAHEKHEKHTGAKLLASVPPKVVSYIEVVRADDVDVVYISLPTAKRAAWIRLCAEYGKHVVSEKPASTSSAELTACLQALAARRLLFMDGTTLTHGQRVQDVRRAVAELGGPEHVNAHMSFYASPAFMSSDIRLQPQLEPQGALGDLGWYCIRWILHVMDFALPTGVTGRVTECDALREKDAESRDKPPPKHKPEAAITGFEGSMEFALPRAVDDASANTPAGVVTASFQCSFHSCHDQTVEIFCRDGTVTVYAAINPTGEDRPRFYVQRHQVAAEPSAATRKDRSAADAKEVFQVYEHVEAADGASDEDAATKMVYSTAPDELDGTYQMEQLWRHVGDSIMQLGKGEPLIANADLAKRWSTHAFITQVVMDRALEAAGAHVTAVETETQP